MPGSGTKYSTAPTDFSFTRFSAHSVGATPVKAEETNLTASVDALLAKVTARTRIVFLANPNNPTGSYLPTGELRRLRAGLPDHVLLVLDSAYAEYVDRDDYTAGADLVDENSNVVMTRTFSKIFGLGAMRLGWCYAPAPIVDVLNRLRPPFNTTTPGQLAGAAAMDDRDHLRRSQDHKHHLARVSRRGAYRHGVSRFFRA